jgi:hypothetical protein
MGTENSSETTKNMAKTLANEIGSNHLSVDIGPIFKVQIILINNFKEFNKNF